MPWAEDIAKLEEAQHLLTGRLDDQENKLDDITESLSALSASVMVLTTETTKIGAGVQALTQDVQSLVSHQIEEKRQKEVAEIKKEGIEEYLRAQGLPPIGGPNSLSPVTNATLAPVSNPGTLPPTPPDTLGTLAAQPWWRDLLSFIREFMGIMADFLGTKAGISSLGFIVLLVLGHPALTAFTAFLEMTNTSTVALDVTVPPPPPEPAKEEKPDSTVDPMKPVPWP